MPQADSPRPSQRLDAARIQLPSVSMHVNARASALELSRRRPAHARTPHRPAHRRRRRPRHPDARAAAAPTATSCASSTCAPIEGEPDAITADLADTGGAARGGARASTRSSISRASPWKPPSRRSCAPTSRAPTTCTRRRARRASAGSSSPPPTTPSASPRARRTAPPLIPVDTPRRPDTYYGLSKCFGEDLAQLYWDLHGIETVSVRIGSCFPEPTSVRMLSVWMSPGRRRPALPRRAHRRRTSATPSSTAPPPTPACGGT